MTSGRASVALGAAALLATLASSALAQPRVPPRPGARMLEQIEALRAEKHSRTPAQRKIGSHLLRAVRERRGQPPAAGVPALRSHVPLDGAGRAHVGIRAEVTPRLLARIAAAGGAVTHTVAHKNAHSNAHADRNRGYVDAYVPLEALETLAALPEVRSLRPALPPFTRKIDTSEGDVAHAADLLRQDFGVDASGISIGVLSDGVDSLASLQASGDLPAVSVLPFQGGSGSEGTAMLEIVHDLAPGANLLFATAFSSQAQFAANIQALRDAGADVIVDDVGYFAEGVFQDDDVAQAVAAVVADGALYFSAAGNGGNLNDGTAGVWEGDFVDSGVVLDGPPGSGVRNAVAHDFDPPGAVYGNEITLDSPLLFTLQWSDPLGDSGSDYDLLLLDETLTVLLDASTSFQNGNDDPFEWIDSGGFDDRGNHLVVVKDDAGEPDRFLHLNANRGRLRYRTAGQISGHPGAAEAIAVTAVDWLDAGGPDGRFDGSEKVERFSSDGPRRIFYHPDGTPVTPGDISSSGGALRQKPDLAAADCVDTATPGFNVFCGTSAAAPHAAAIAALLLDLGSTSGATPQDVRVAMLAGALDIEAPGVDRDSGAGIVDAVAAGDVIRGPQAGGGRRCGLGFELALLLPALARLRRRSSV